MKKRIQTRLAFYAAAALAAACLAWLVPEVPAHGQDESAAPQATSREAVHGVAEELEELSKRSLGGSAWGKQVDQLFSDWLVKPLDTLLFYNVANLAALFGRPEQVFGLEPGAELPKIPVVVLWMIVGAIYFTIQTRFVGLWAFKHAIDITRGLYDDPEDKGEVSHFQALSSALSGTIGLGNIAGVATAVCLGGPGAVFWMTVAGFFGMSSKFVECSLGMLYREISPDGKVSGGPMHYLRDGLRETGWGWLGAILSPLFAVMCIGGAVGGGCAYQVNQSLRSIEPLLPSLGEHQWIYGPAYGALMVALVGVVIIGGIKQIAATAEKIVPFMAALFIVCSLTILFVHRDRVLPGFQTIFTEAFTPAAGLGGLVGVMFMGFRRAAFSNEAGIGSASIAHSAAKAKEPMSEGIVALLEPFIDTVVLCNMTGLLIVVTGGYNAPEFAHLDAAEKAAVLAHNAFASVTWWFPYLLATAVFLFAYATCISWSYYGERCWSFLFGERSSILYKALFLMFAFLGAIVTAKNALEFSDLMILAMAFPNILGAVLLSPVVYRELLEYWGRVQANTLRNDPSN